MMKVLIAEDDRLIRQGLAEVFEAEGYEPIVAYDGEAALRLFRERAPDFICLDVMMPKRNGYDVCREIRQLNHDVPVVFITAKTEEVDKVLGLELGADDFIVKPFGVKEVIARIRAIIRRCGVGQSDQHGPFRMGDIDISPRELRAKRGAQVIDLSQRDINILRLLFDRRGQAVDRNTLFLKVWGRNYLPSSRTLDQHVSQLRKRIELDAANPVIIRTVHGVGYRYEPEADGHSQ